MLKIYSKVSTQILLKIIIIINIRKFNYNINKRNTKSNKFHALLKLLMILTNKINKNKTTYEKIITFFT